MNYQDWIEHFRKNANNRPEPEWDAPVTLSPKVVKRLVRSLEQFELGDGGGPAYLIAWDKERFWEEDEVVHQLVDLWFAEEIEHSRLLGDAVRRFGGKKIESHWSFSIFCWLRKWLGVRFELTVLLLTELVSTVYYRLMWRHGEDTALRAMCRLIIRDETGHVAFHRARLAHSARSGEAVFGLRWEVWFRILGFAAGTMLWINHRPGVTALGATTPEFYREVWAELSRFVTKLRREGMPEAAALPRRFSELSLERPS